MRAGVYLVGPHALYVLHHVWANTTLPTHHCAGVVVCQPPSPRPHATPMHTGRPRTHQLPTHPPAAHAPDATCAHTSCPHTRWLPTHSLAVLVVISADVAEVSGKGLHGQRAGDFPAPPLDDDACGGDRSSGPIQSAQFLGVGRGEELDQYCPSRASAER